jgi:hypothetical protein
MHNHIHDALAAYIVVKSIGNESFYGEINKILGSVEYQYWYTQFYV